MDDHDRHWHDAAATDLRIAALVAVIAASVAAGALLGFFAVKAFANASHAVTHAEEWRM